MGHCARWEAVLSVGLQSTANAMSARVLSRYEPEWWSCPMTEGADLLVIGAGPAGMAAAVRARSAGLSVLVVDTLARPGGQIWRQGPGHSLPQIAVQWFDRFARSGARFIGGHTITMRGPRGGLVADPVLGSAPVTAPATTIQSQATILATGARELFLPFPGWTLLGVMGVGGAQALVKSGARLVGKTAIVAGSGPLLLEAAASLAHSGIRVTAILEQAPTSRIARFAAGLWRHPSKMAQAAQLRARLIRSPYRTGHWITRARPIGDQIVAEFTDGRRSWDRSCDLLCVGFGLIPETRLAQLLGCAISGDGSVTVDPSLHTTVEGIFAAGESTRVGGVDLAIVEGELAGLGATAFVKSEEVLPHPALARRRAGLLRFLDQMDAAFALRPELRFLPEEQTPICRCEDVLLGELDSEWGGREAKLNTRLGMGPCQAAVCGPATEFLFGWPREGPRPPVHPTRLTSFLRVPDTDTDADTVPTSDG